MSKSKNILVAPLNWGLGHATRCIPIINELLQHGFTPILASDSDALVLLQQEFPELTSVELPAYNIKYTKNGRFLKWALLSQLPKLYSAIKREQQQLQKIVTDFNIHGIISDNRLGLYHQQIPSVYITHQINILSGNSTFLSSYLHQKTIRKFDECWVPDSNTKLSFSGKLSQPNHRLKNIKHIGILSRFKYIDTPIQYDFLILLSGPEPQRSLLETKLLKELQNTSEKILFIQGILSKEQVVNTVKNITICNFMIGKQLENAINESSVVISRSGYTTIMDLAQIGKKAFFIPTPGQYEQLYLAKRMNDLNLVPFATQENFCLADLKQLNNYEGLHNTHEHINFNELFSIFN